MQDYLPEADWKPWLFSKTPAGYWSVRANRVAYMSWLDRKLGFRRSEDWYEVDDRVFAENGGLGLLWNYYRGSVLSALRDCRPEVNWKPWLFRKVPNGFWKDRGNRLKYYDWLGSQMGYRSAKDWERLTREVFRKKGATYLLEGYFRGSMPAMQADIQSRHN
jgi:hypothetical protein